MTTNVPGVLHNWVGLWCRLKRRWLIEPPRAGLVANGLADLPGAGIRWQSSPTDPELVVRRDTFGQLPLVYAEQGPRVAIASSESVLRQQLVQSGSVNESQFHALATQQLDHFDPTRGLLNQVQQVPPGHDLVVQNGTIKLRRWQRWCLDFSLDQASPRQQSEALRLALEAATMTQGPCAVACSGGLDSSSLAALARQHQPSRPLPLLSFQDDYCVDQSEEQMLRDLSEALNSPIVRIGRAPQAIATVAREVAISEWPQHDPHWSLHFQLVDQARQRGAQAILSGHWSDQLFDGDYALSFLLGSGRLAASIRQLQGLWQAFGPHEAYALSKQNLRMGLGYYLKAKQRAAWCEAVMPAELYAETPAHRRFDVARRLAILQHPGTALTCHWHQRLASQAGLVWHFPFLDAGVVACILSLSPASLNLQGTPRWLLRQAMAADLPQSIMTRHWRHIRADEDLVSVRTIAQRQRTAETLWRKQVTSETSMDKTEPKTESQAKLPYEPPRLEELGDFHTLTQAKGGTNRDGPSSKPFTKLTGSPG